MSRTLSFYRNGLLGEGKKKKNGITVDALIFYEGTFQGAYQDDPITYDADRIRLIAENTNNNLAKGTPILVFKDHIYSQDSKIGRITQPLTAEVITKENLPNQAQESLIGLMGIFGKIDILGQKNIEAYEAGNLKELSAGLDVDENSVFEVSAAGIPVLEGAALFGRLKLIDAIAIYGTNLSETQREQRQKNAASMMWELFDTFTMTLLDIAESDESNKEVLQLQAVDDLSEQIKAVLELPPPEPEPLVPVSIFNRETMSNPTDQNQPPEDDKLLKENEELKQKLAQFERQQKVTAKYSDLRDKAAKLRDEGKLTPAEFQDTFGDRETNIATYSKDDGVLELKALEKHLDQVEKYASPVPFGKKTAPVIDPDEAEEKTKQSEAKTNRIVESFNRSPVGI